MQTYPTNQELFNNALFGIRSQNGFSVSLGSYGQPKCRYRAPDGKKCAIGWNIPDNLYKLEWEYGEILSNILISCNIIKSYNENIETYNFCHELQTAHDDQGTMEEWEDRMKVLASAYNLIYTPKEESTN